MKKIMFILIMVLSVMALVSCSKGDKQVPEKDDLSQKTESETFGNVDKKVADEELEEDDGPYIRVDLGEIGENLSLPDSFPKDVLPLPEDANIVNVNEGSDNKGIGIIFKTGKSFDEAITYCQDIMKDGTIFAEDKKDDSYFLMGNKDKYSIMISVSKYNGEEISILFSVTPQ